MQLKSVVKSTDEENFMKMKAAYDACLNEDSIKKQGVAPLLKIINDVKQIYPLMASPSKDIGILDERLQQAILYLDRMDITAIIAPYTGADDKDPDKVIVAVTPPYRIGLPAKELYQDERVLGKYKTAISEVLSSLLGTAMHSAAVDEVVEFEKKLAAAAPDAEDQNDVTVSLAYNASFWALLICA